MKITWEVSDGYVGKGRPQTSTIEDDEILFHDNVGEAMSMIENIVQQDFENSISWNIDNYEQIEEKVGAMLDAARPKAKHP